MASDSKYDTPPATPEQKAAARAAVAATAGQVAQPAFNTNHLDSEAKEADVADGEMMVSTDPRAIEIVKGFGIEYMTMKNADTREMKWQTGKWGLEMFDTEIEVCREICFSSKELMNNFKMTQRVLVFGKCTEEWTFKFGFVIPGSTNTWEQTIVAAPKERMLPASLLSGNLVVETTFTDGSLLVAKTLVRIYYDEVTAGSAAPAAKK